MKKIRLIPVGSIADTYLHNVASAMSARQSFYDLSVSPEAVEVQSNPLPDGCYNEDHLESEILGFAGKKLADEFPVGICKLPLRGELSSSFDGKSAIVSIHGWKQVYPDVSTTTLLEYALVDILLTRQVDLPAHEETRGCPGDFCDDRSDRLVGLSRGEYCPECRAGISAAMRSGRISLQEVAALQRILDEVAGRKRAFVLMPFEDRFDHSYRTCIKPALERLKWVCRRADEIHKAHAVLDLIWEGIHTADLIIADLTTENPNVFYEVGYSQAVGRPTLLLAQCMDSIPFDLRSQQVLLYDEAQVADGSLGLMLEEYMRDMYEDVRPAAKAAPL